MGGRGYGPAGKEGVGLIRKAEGQAWLMERACGGRTEGFSDVNVKQSRGDEMADEKTELVGWNNSALVHVPVLDSLPYISSFNDTARACQPVEGVAV
jgi:hypothetical protein